MGLLDELTSADSGVTPARGVAGGAPIWKPARERSHPEGIEGVIADVGKTLNQNAKDNDDPYDSVIVVRTEEQDWRVFGSVRDLRDRFETLKEDDLLVPGTRIALRFFGGRKETAKDGSPYTVHSYAVAAEAGDGTVPPKPDSDDGGSPPAAAAATSGAKATDDPPF